MNFRESFGCQCKLIIVVYPCILYVCVVCRMCACTSGECTSIVYYVLCMLYYICIMYDALGY
jgi:hypothetical protein